MHSHVSRFQTLVLTPRGAGAHVTHAGPVCLLEEAWHLLPSVGRDWQMD